ncbi:reverse transcriptase [Gossypium australe]|uniref:Reverse transcriptase n=1 Tax=Gossypium australe TaxID=47621 RepID=A0A5B6X0P3_9ROSI|nr:reverse transcriptase [Gossypium australe]
MDNKELEFYEEGLEKGNICAIEGELTKLGVNYPRIIISRPRNVEGGAQGIPKIIIQRPISLPYKDNKRVPWNYNYNVAIQGVESSTSTSEEEPEALVNEPVKEEEAKEFLKFLKHSEYSVVEQLHRQPALISVLALLLRSEVHREALMKVLNETYVTKDISVNKLDRLATLKRLLIDSSHMKACQNIVRAFDGTERRVMGRMDVPLLIGPNTYEVDFLVMDINPSYNCLLGRPWIHLAGAVPSSLHQKLKLVTKNRLVTINSEEDIIVTVTNEAPYLETNEEAIECSFQSLEFVNVTFISEGNEVPVPMLSKTTRMGLRMMIGKGALPGKGLGKHLQRKVQILMLKEKRDRFGLGFKPDAKQIKKEIEKKQERRRARLNGEDVKWESMTFPHISHTFVSKGVSYPKKESSRDGHPHINAIHDEETDQGNLSGIRPYEPGSVLNNWTAEEFPVVYRDYTESLDINDMSSDTIDSEVCFKQDMCSEESQGFESDRECDLPPNLLRMVEQEEKQILPHKESVEMVNLGEGQEVKIGACITVETKRDLIEFLQVVKYSDWVANIVLVPKKDGKVRMCMDYMDLNKVSPKDNFSLPHIDTLVDNTAGYSLFSFMDGFSGYNQIKIHPEDIDKTTFVTMWGKFCYKMMPFGLKMRERHIREPWLRKFELKLNPAKCTFGARSRKLLGFIVSEKGIEVDPNKVKAIQELSSPRTQKEVRGFLGRLNYIALFISELTERCDPIFRLLKKHNPGTWDEECQKTFDKVKQYLSNAPVLMPPHPNKPLILYLTVLDNSMGCVLGQHDESGKKERAIYYLIYVVSYNLAHLEARSFKIYGGVYRLNGRMARWQILLSEFDIVYVNQKTVKGRAIADFLASRALEDYEPFNFDFSNEDLMYVAVTEEGTSESHPWKLNFDGASNAVGNGIGAVLIAPNGDHYPFSCKLDFDCINNMAEYEACIMGIRAAIERKIRVLEVYGDSALMADALATLASMVRINENEDMKPIQMSIYQIPAHCHNVEEKEKIDHPCYHDILKYIKNREYPDQATENDKRTLRRLACEYVLDGEVLYKKRKDQVLLRCVDATEAKQILEEVHEGVCGTHANGFIMARQIMRFGYYWSTMEGDCINYAKKCHKCQIYGDKIHVPPSPLHMMTSPWPFSMWGMDVIGPISPKASNGHRLIFVVIDYFTKWVEAASYAKVTKSAVSRFLKK